MQEIDLRDIDRLLKRFDQVIQEHPERKRKLLEELGQEVLEDVRTLVGGSGKVQGWQERYVGSKGGYVAVRAKSKTYADRQKNGKRYAVGYVTNAIENGHRHRRPRPTGEDNYRYKGAISAPSVPGKHFYNDARSDLEAQGTEKLRQLVAEIVARLEVAE